MTTRLTGGIGPTLATDGFDGTVAGLGHAETDDDVGPETLFKIGQEIR